MTIIHEMSECSQLPKGALFTTSPLLVLRIRAQQIIILEKNHGDVLQK